MNEIRRYERDKIYYGKDHDLSEKHFDSLVQYNDRHDQKFFSVIHRGIKLHQYVGVIKVGNVSIEILPKLDNTIEKTEERKYWQDILLQMLKECRILSPSAPTKADLNLRPNSLLDLYFELFVKEVEYLVRRGLIKRYVSKSENSTTVKGKIEFDQHIKKNIIHKERFFVSYQDYSQNHLINQILLQTLRVVKDVSEDTALQSRISKLEFTLPALEEIKVAKQHFDKITFDRKNEKYREALKIAELLLLNYSPDIKTGRNNVLALLFDMETLFEEYVFRRLKKLSMKQDFQVLRQTSKQFWKSKTIRPDIVFKRKGKTTVLDTKWKSLSAVNPSADDLRQMFLYNQYFGSELSVLVYPQASNLNSEKELYKEPADLFQINNTNVAHGCMVYFMPIVSEKGLNYTATEKLVKKLHEAN